MHEKKIGDLIRPLGDWPHMPYWGALKEAIVQLNISHETGHDTVLVFDEAYALVGLLTQKDVLKALDTKDSGGSKQGVPVSWDDMLKPDIQERLSRPVQDFMSKVKTKFDAGDSILSVSRIMSDKGVCMVPVLEANRVIGVVTMGDLFHEITNAILKL
jgi:predicted transcriptional regulator